MLIVTQRQKTYTLRMVTFLKNDVYPVVIAKIAIVFQFVITILICSAIFLTAFTTVSLIPFITVFFYLDILFVITHMTYRALYAGKKSKTQYSGKRVLIIHILFSILALILTYLMITNQNYFSSVFFTVFTMASWIMSLIFGFLFYSNKYSKTVLE